MFLQNCPFQHSLYSCYAHLGLSHFRALCYHRLNSCPLLLFEMRNWLYTFLKKLVWPEYARYAEKRCISSWEKGKPEDLSLSRQCFLCRCNLYRTCVSIITRPAIYNIQHSDGNCTGPVTMCQTRSPS